MNKSNKRYYTCIAWDVWYQMAEEYYHTYHNLRIPVKYKTAKGFALGRWIERQRAAYNKKRGYQIEQRHIYLLNQIGMEWVLSIRTQWDDWYHYCVQYYGKNGHLDIPKDFEVNGMHLGEWIIYQRKRYHQKRMNMKQIEKLEWLGMTWKIRTRRGWEEWYQDARHYYNVNGNLEVPFRYISETGYKLGDWIHRQRETYRGIKGGSLDTQKISLLNKIEMRW